jgi:peroxiredoxin
LKDLENNPIQLNAFQGKVVLLYFWTTWWVWCRKEVSSLIKLYNEFKNEGFVVIGIDVREGKKTVKKYVDKYKLTFQVLLDIHGKVEKKYGVRAHPEHFLVNRRGELIGKTLGPRNWMRSKNRDLIRFLLDQEWRLQEITYALSSWTRILLKKYSKRH